MKSVYMAGSVHHADDGGHGWRNELRETFPQLVWVNPLDKYDGNANDVLVLRKNSPRGLAVGPDVEVVPSAEIVEEDKEFIDECDAVLVGWSPDIPACGTPMEVLYAWQQDTPVVVWLRSSDSITDVSPWLDYHADHITTTAENAVRYIDNNV